MQNIVVFWSDLETNNSKSSKALITSSTNNDILHLKGSNTYFLAKNAFNLFE